MNHQVKVAVLQAVVVPLVHPAVVILQLTVVQLTIIIAVLLVVVHRILVAGAVHTPVVAVVATHQAVQQRQVDRQHQVRHPMGPVQ